MAENKRLAEKLGIGFPILSDSDATVISEYGVLHPAGGIGGRDIARPAVLLIGPDGVIAWRDLTDNWRVRVGSDEILAAIEAAR